MSVPSTTDRARRHPEVAALVGVVAGIFSAIVKFGWEVPFPPRTLSETQRIRPSNCWSSWDSAITLPTRWCISTAMACRL